jgi:hypothetical protein
MVNIHEANTWLAELLRRVEAGEETGLAPEPADPWPSSSRTGARADHDPARSRGGALPGLHEDPFDRMLVAQARAERLTMPPGAALVSRTTRG